ncbi:MAG: hypothetical protein ABUT39_24045 [Acidobacteriota bacterium]
MSAAGFQSALARMVVDPDFRDGVRERGEAALPDGLSDLERERLVHVAGHPGLDVTRTLHKGFRLSKLLTWLPLTCSVLGGDALAREVGEFWRRRLPVTFYYLEEAIGFCDHLLERMSAGAERDVVAYERASLELQRARPEGVPVPLQVVHLRHDPQELLTALSQGEPLAGLSEQPCRLVGIKEDGCVEWRILEPQSLHQS